jgi:WhiB family transcriptional regulator, redox-sensing transcriptional regulator
MTNVTRLPGPIADVWDWQRLGLCRGRDSAQFFHPDGERGASRGRREASAKSVCRACPVRAECAAQALSSREPYGVWGGFTEAERLRLLAQGWEDCADRRATRVDVERLEARLGLRPVTVAVSPAGQRPGGRNASTAPTPTHPAPNLPAQRRAASSSGVSRTRSAAR